MQKLLFALVVLLFTIPTYTYGAPTQWWRITAYTDRVAKLDAVKVQDLRVPILLGVKPGSFKDTWQEARSNGKIHEGTDMFAPQGALIVSPTDAVVTRIDTSGAGGIAVYTANPGSETFYYAHLDHVASGLTLGQELKAGDLIGYVGNTGNAVGSSPHLHFTIYSLDGPVNPYTRLTKEFSTSERLAAIRNVLVTTKYKDLVARAFSEQYRAFFINAQTSGETIPSEIASLLTVSAQSAVPTAASVVSMQTPVTPTFPTVTQTPPVYTNGSPVGILKMGDTGQEVKKLQQYLIAQNSGELAGILATYGPTGVFGRLTKNTLIEFQKKAGITPAVGMYGPVTRAYIAAQS